MDQRTRQAMAFFVGKAWKAHQAAGIVGNLLSESGLNPTVKPRDNGTAHGIAQWRFDRFTGLQRFSANNGWDWRDLNTQLEYVHYELNNHEKAAGDRIRAARNVQEANDGMIMFERPFGSNRGARFAHNYRGRQANSTKDLSLWGGGADYLGAQATPTVAPRPVDDIFPARAGEVQAPSEINPLTPLAAPSPPTWEEQVEKKKQEPQEYDNWFDELGASFQTGTIASQIYYKYKLSDFDPDFVPDEDRFIEAMDRIPQEYHPRLMAANSENSFQMTLKWIEEDMERVQRLGKGGASATVAGLTSGIFDPVNFIPVGGVYAAGGKIATKAGRVAYGAAVGGTTSFALEVASKNLLQDPHADPLMGAVVGAGFGALGGLLMRNPHARLEAEMAHDASLKVLKETRDNSAADRVDLKGNAGAARNPELMDGLMAGEDNALSRLIDMNDSDVAKAFGGKLRFDIVGSMSTSQNPFVRKIGMWLADETVGARSADGSHAVIEDSVNARYTTDYRQRNGAFLTGYIPAKVEWLKTQEFSKLNPLQKGGLELEFNRLVNEQIRNPRDAADPHVKKAAQTLQKGLAKFAQDMNEAGLWNGKAKDTYLPLIANHNRIAEIDRLVHSEVVEEAIKRAVIKHSPDIDKDLAALIASGYYQRIRRASYGMANPVDDALHLGDREGFIKGQMESFPQGHKFSEDDLGRVFDDLMGAVEKQAAKREAINRNARKKDLRYLKRRTLLDYNYEADIRRRDESMIRFKVRDFFEDDAEFVYRRYMRQMSGRLAFANSPIRHPKTGEVLLDGVKSGVDFDKVKEMVKESYRRSGRPKTEWDRELDNVLENMDFMWKRINGIPVMGQEKAWAQWMRRIGTVQFIRLMANMGLNQVQESVKIFALTGWRSAWSSLPALRTMVDGVSSGKYPKDKLLAEVQDMTGLGMDNLYSPRDLRMHDDRLGSDIGNGFTQKIDAYLDAGSKITANLTLFRQIHAFQQKWAAKAIVRQMADMARAAQKSDGSFDFSKITKGDRDKLATMGLGEEDATKLFRNLLDHGEFEGSHVVGINVDKWDGEVLSKFRVFLHRYTDRLVQTNDYGALHRWMSHPAAALFVQFRGFVFGAWTKSTLWGINHFDSKTLILALAEVAAGVATYAIRQAPQVTTEEGRAKYMEDLSNPAKLLAKGWSRAASASIMPMVADTILRATPTNFRFDARASGSATDAIFGNPAIDQATSAFGFVRGMGSAALNLQAPTQNTIKSGVRSLVPFSNWIAFQAVLGAMIAPLPTKHTQ